MQKTPKGLRLCIGIFGRRNAGKSTLLNGITRQDVSIVSETRGTTTDPVEKAMELQPLGPILFIDTAGIDDIGALGEMRVQRSMAVIDRTDIALLLIEQEAGEFEEKLVAEFCSRKIPVIAVLSKTDICKPSQTLEGFVNTNELPMVRTALTRDADSGLDELRTLIIRHAPEEFINSPGILSDLVPAGELAVLVVPIDLEAPKGRLILPQVQSIRDLLDNDSYCMIVKERELRTALELLNRPPALVVTDSQAFLKAGGDTPPEIPLTSFSILFARFKGDLVEFVRGLNAIDHLSSGSRILVAEACSHHPIGEDIGRVKIPRWLRQYTGVKLEFDTVQGHDFPEDLSPYSMVIHCGGCVWNRREMLTRMMRCRNAHIPITNYGLVIAYSLGICSRALQPFPAALEIFTNSQAVSNKIIVRASTQISDSRYGFSE